MERQRPWENTCTAAVSLGLTIAAVIFGPAALAGDAPAQRQPDGAAHERVRKLIHLVINRHIPNLDKIRGRGWSDSTFMTGLMAAYRATRDEKYLDYVRRWAEKHEYGMGRAARSSIDSTPGQVYLELYMAIGGKGDVEQALAGTRKVADEILASPKRGREVWGCDSCYFDAPTFARLGHVTGDVKYFELTHRCWWPICDKLFDTEAGLIYRGGRWKPKPATAEKPAQPGVFWARGNGWAIGGLVRVLEYLPKNDARRSDYLKMLRAMAEALVRCQPADGLWRTGLTDWQVFPDPETSGSGFFCYALAKAINEGWLDRDRYLPSVQKAWHGLTRCVDRRGGLNWVQPGARAPGRVRPRDWGVYAQYAVGALLLAGEQVLKLTEGELAACRDLDCIHLAVHGKGNILTASIKLTDLSGKKPNFNGKCVVVWGSEGPRPYRIENEVLRFLSRGSRTATVFYKPGADEQLAGYLKAYGEQAEKATPAERVEILPSAPGGAVLPWKNGNSASGDAKLYKGESAP